MKVFGFLFIAFFTFSCLSDIALEDDVKAKENQTQILAYFASQNQSPIALSGGSYYFVTKSNPSGELASKGDSLYVHYEFSNLATGKVLDSTNRATNSPYFLKYGSGNPVFVSLFTALREGEQATMVIPGTAQSFPDLPAYTPLKVRIKSYVVRTQDDLIREYIARNAYTVTETMDNGLRYIRLKAGTGDIPAQGKIVKIKYIGRFLSSKAFDGNMARTDSMSVTIGGTQTVPGFQMGIEKMRLGEKAVIVFPSALGYGANGNSSIPGYTPLSFEIYIAKIE
ncbi:MAG: FKBP-type peptidyl-prolyl cis-trans isomerase [Cytophagales bacterium]|jgi:FKBP-type peptidyl-prolyl cis-trans isomerase|nr:FKBP-type peptidyl-prolyl cis-trans isomerase [Cytophagales bacterium]